jgi:SAM-dependent methyltransferase
MAMTLDQLAPVRCVLCGRSGGHGPVFDGLLTRCGGCGFTWTATPPSDDLYEDAYAESGGYGWYLDALAQRRFEAGRRLRWLLSGVRPASLLEAGCAAGFFLEAARTAGIAASGVEMCGYATRYAVEHLGLPVRQGAFEASTPARPVDVVCAFHVLEHVDDPARFLAAARRALLPDGWLALEVPNIESAAASRIGAGWHAIAPAYHRWHFSIGTLTRLLADHGFEVVTVDTVFSRFYRRAVGRWTHARGLIVADVASSRSLGMVHPHLGDMMRVLARRTKAGTR